MQVTDDLLPLNTRVHSPNSITQPLAVLSALPENNILLNVVKHKTVPSCSFKPLNFSPVITSQQMMVESPHVNNNFGF